MAIIGKNILTSLSRHVITRLNHVRPQIESRSFELRKQVFKIILPENEQVKVKFRANNVITGGDKLALMSGKNY
ncbi:hypothetical protein yrohd0001_2910 [Yersinia rohdei ATCC 43380]|nr:hypothetical protein yrohd0001_2910 [Yersinia rohdei ATCC 43380]